MFFFKHHGAEKYLLKNINFTALPGQTTAIIGVYRGGQKYIGQFNSTGFMM